MTTTMSERFWASWQRIVAAAFALAVFAAPALALAQGGGTGDGGGGTGSGTGGPPPGGAPGSAPGAEEGGRGLAWIAIILAIAIIFYLFSRRRRGAINR